jgi:hypothetical protein
MQGITNFSAVSEHGGIMHSLSAEDTDHALQEAAQQALSLLRRGA